MSQVVRRASCGQEEDELRQLPSAVFSGINRSSTTKLPPLVTASETFRGRGRYRGTGFRDGVGQRW